MRKPLIRTRGGGVRAGGGSNPSDAPEPATRYTITVTSSNTSQGTVTGGGTYTEGDTVTLRATAKSGYEFTGWYSGNSKVSEANPYTFTASQNRTLVARFAEVQADFYYGAVTPDGTSGNAYDKSDVVSELTAGWIGSSSTITTPNIEVGAGEKFIMLYNPLKVKPTSGSLVSGGLTTRYVENDFTDDATFLIPENGKTVNEVTYNVVETWDAMGASDVVMQVTFTKQ